MFELPEIPLWIFLIPFAIFMLLYVLFGIFNIFHLLKYGVYGLQVFAVVFIFTAGSIVLAVAAFEQLQTYDWTTALQLDAQIPTDSSQLFDDFSL